MLAVLEGVDISSGVDVVVGTDVAWASMLVTSEVGHVSVPVDPSGELGHLVELLNAVTWEEVNSLSICEYVRYKLIHTSISYYEQTTVYITISTQSGNLPVR